MKLLKDIRAVVDTILFWTVSIIFVLMILMTLCQVVLRYFFNAPLGFVDEGTGFCLVFVTLLGSAWLIGQKGHIAMTMMMDGMKDRRNVLTIQSIIVCVGIFFSAVVLIWGGSQLAYAVRDQLSSVMGISMGLIYSVLPISGILSVFYFIVELFEINDDYNKANQENQAEVK